MPGKLSSLKYTGGSALSTATCVGVPLNQQMSANILDMMDSLRDGTLLLSTPITGRPPRRESYFAKLWRKRN